MGQTGQMSRRNKEGLHGQGDEFSSGPGPMGGENVDTRNSMKGDNYMNKRESELGPRVHSRVSEPEKKYDK